MKPFRKAKHAKSGFTLIEILVVIAIVVLLAALLFPVFQSVRARSRTTVCISNLKQLGLAISQYAADYDDRLPYAPNPSTKEVISRPQSYYGEPLDSIAATLPDIRFALKPYGATPALFFCPSDHMSRLMFKGDPGFKPTHFERWGSSYDYDDESGLNRKMLGSYRVPAQSYLMDDGDEFHGTSMDSGEPYAKGARLNVLFADMHVKTVNWEQAIAAREASAN